LGLKRAVAAATVGYAKTALARSMCRAHSSSRRFEKAALLRDKQDEKPPSRLSRYTAYPSS